MADLLSQTGTATLLGLEVDFAVAFFVLADDLAKADREALRAGPVHDDAAADAEDQHGLVVRARDGEVDAEVQNDFVLGGGRANRVRVRRVHLALVDAELDLAGITLLTFTHWKPSF